MAKHVFSGVVDADAVARLREFLSANAGQDVLVELNSPGGSPFSGLEAFHALREHGRADIEVTGLAASSASLLAMGARKLTMKASTTLMVHRASAMSLGDADVHRATAGVLDTIDVQMTDIYVARSKQPRAKIKKLLEDESWLTPRQAVALGLADAAEPLAQNEMAARVAASIGDFPHLNATKLAAALRAAANEGISPMPKINLEAGDDPAITADATAIQKIYASADAAGLTLRQANKIVAESGGDLDAAKDRIIALVHALRATPETIPTDHVSNDNPETLAGAVTDLVYARLSHTPVKAGTPAEGLQNDSVLDIAARVFQANGGKIRSRNPHRLAAQIFAEAGRHSTSDFPDLLVAGGERYLADKYAVNQSPLKSIARRRSAKDFRTIAALRIGETPKLIVVPEGGEVTYASRAETKESYKLFTYGRIFALTREAFVNDDLGAFADVIGAGGEAAARVEADALWALISGDGVDMSDGKTFWHADHSNIGSGPLPITVATLSEARRVIRQQKGIDNESHLNLTPAFLLVGPRQETGGELVLSSIAAAKVADANVFAGKMTLLVEPRIEDDSWFVFASPGQAETIAYSNLGDATAPMLETRAGWSTLGVEYRTIYDFGCGAVGVRGSYRNDGAGDTE